MVVGRLAVRKGLEDVVALSHHLSRINADLRLRVIGARRCGATIAAHCRVPTVR